MKNLNNKHSVATKTALATALALCIALPATAGDYNRYQGADYTNTSYDYAKVVNVDPIVERYEVNEPIQQCWNERVPVRHSSRHYRSKSMTPEILGAIIGGVVGNQVGKRGGGKARDVATVAGAVLGGSIGRDVKHKNAHRNRHYDRHRDYARYDTVQRCEMRDNYVQREQVVGYNVAYKYRGNVFHTQMDQEPGNKIRVKVTVDPV